MSFQCLSQTGEKWKWKCKRKVFGIEKNQRAFFTLIYLYIVTPKLFAYQSYLPIVPSDGLLGDNRYRKSPYDIVRVQELLLGETVRGLNVTVIERNLLGSPWIPDFSCLQLLSCRIPDSLNSRLLNLLSFRLFRLWTFRVAEFSTLDFSSCRVFNSFDSWLLE